MKTETFCEHFGTFAEAPNGVAKLREMILQLAVQCKLVPQDGKDEPAAELLKRIANEKAEMVRRKTITDRDSPPITENEIPFEISGSWQWCRICDIAHDLGQRTPEEQFTYIDVGAINKELGIVSDDVQILEPHAAPSRARKIVSVNSVIYSTVRPYLLNVAVIETEFKPTPIVSTAFAVLHPHDGMISRFIYHYLRSKPFVAYVESEMTGVAYPAINDGKMYRGLIPVPPTVEQRRIVEKVDQLLTLCDELEARQKARGEARERLVGATLDRLVSNHSSAEFPVHVNRLRNNFDQLFDAPTTVPQLRQAILQLAVQGQLVPQDPNDEPTIGHYSDIVEAVPYSTPNCWRWQCVSDVFDVSGGITKNPKRTPVKNHYPYLRVANVQRGRLKLEEIERFELVDGELDRWRLKPGDILVVEGNGSADEIGRCALWNGEISDCVHQNHIIRCRPLIRDVQEFVLLFLNSPPGISGMKERAITTSGLYSLSVGKIRSLVVPIPPLAEQRRIVTRVTELLSLCDKLESELTQTESASTEVLSAAVHHLLSTRMGCQ